MEARLKWIDGLQFVGEAPSGHAVLLDGGKEGGGADTAVHPMEMLLLALGGCTGMDVISILRKKKQAVSGFEIRLKGERAPDHPKRFVRIELEFVIRGKDIDEAAVARAISLSYDKYCSVRATLQGTPTIEVRHRIETA